MQRFLVVMTVLAGLVLPGFGRAAEVEADPRKSYVVTPEVGPWMICVTSYTGTQAVPLAHTLALEIRQRDNLPAWVFNRGDEERRKQQAERERLKQQFPDADLSRLRRTRIEDQCAVMIGGYKDFDAARRDLDRVKKLKPPRDEKLMPLLMEVNPVQTNQGTKGEIRGAHLNPFPSSFVTRNPTVPAPPRENKPDLFLKKLNEDEPYSLLKCRQPWTLVVKTFEGASTYQTRNESSSGFLDKLRASFSGSGDLLTASALQAREVAKVLKQSGFDAYVLHTRNQSIVTIGGYPTAEDGNLQLIQRKIANLQLGPIKLFSNPIPMEVPRL